MQENACLLLIKLSLRPRMNQIMPYNSTAAALNKGGMSGFNGTLISNWGTLISDWGTLISNWGTLISDWGTLILDKNVPIPNENTIIRFEVLKINNNNN